MQTPLENIQYSEISRQWNKALFQIKAALANADLAAYTAAVARRDEMLAKLKEIEEASFVSREAAEAVDVNFISGPLSQP